jgi:hypothetical protein
MASFLLVASTAPAQDVGYNFDQQADFTKYKTYKWVTVKGSSVPNDLIARQITDSIDRQLATKGLVKTDSDTADLYVAYQVAVDQEKQMTTWDTGYAMGPAWGPRYYGGYYGGGGMSTSTTSTINVGTLALDMYDRATKQLVWRGMASKQLDTKAKPEKRQKNLDKGMAKLLKNYPPKAK